MGVPLRRYFKIRHAAVHEQLQAHTDYACYTTTTYVTAAMNGTVARYSVKEISNNDGSNGSRVWIIVNDKVYDVTNEIEQHPGGGELITEYAGKDATRAFNDFGHSAEAMADFKKLLIGELIEEDKKVNRGKKNQTAQSTEKSPIHRSFLSIISCGICP